MNRHSSLSRYNNNSPKYSQLAERKKSYNKKTLSSQQSQRQISTLGYNPGYSQQWEEVQNTQSSQAFQRKKSAALRRYLQTPTTFMLENQRIECKNTTKQKEQWAKILEKPCYREKPVTGDRKKRSESRNTKSNDTVSALLRPQTQTDSSKLVGLTCQQKEVPDYQRDHIVRENGLLTTTAPASPLKLQENLIGPRPHITKVDNNQRCQRDSVALILSDSKDQQSPSITGCQRRFNERHNRHNIQLIDQAHTPKITEFMSPAGPTSAERNEIFEKSKRHIPQFRPHQLTQELIPKTASFIGGQQMRCVITDRIIQNPVKPESISKRVKNLKDYLSDLPVLSIERPADQQVNSQGGLLARPQSALSKYGRKTFVSTAQNQQFNISTQMNNINNPESPMKAEASQKVNEDLKNAISQNLMKENRKTRQRIDTSTSLNRTFLNTQLSFLHHEEPISPQIITTPYQKRSQERAKQGIKDAFANSFNIFQSFR